MKILLLCTLALTLTAGCSKPTPPAPERTEAAAPKPVTKAAAKAAAPTATAPKAKAMPSSMPSSMPAAMPSSMPAAMPGAGAPHAGATSMPTSMPAALPGSGGGKLPPGHPPMPAGDVKGTLKLDPKLKDAVRPGAVIFLVARRDTGGQGKGMLLAAKKIPVTGADMFPVAYTLTQADVMMQGTQLNGVVQVSARVDGDGDALSKTPGDLTGKANTAVPVGSVGVDITLDTKL